MENTSLSGRLFHRLQDPHLVARFQQLCGVRGTFTSTAAGTERNRGGDGAKRDRERALGNGACPGDAPGDDGEAAAAGAGEPRRGASRGRHKAAKKRDEPAEEPGEDEEALPRNGAATLGREPAAGGAVKPLRKNSLTGDAGQEFIIENRFLYYLFTFGTELGNELFYITFFPFVMWNVDAFVARRLIAVWVWVMYLGQCTKDLLGWARPASPPVVKVEMFYNSEYSMPSTHAMSGTAIPFALFYMTHGRWEYPFAVGFSVALSWCVLVCVSRIYMGMHSLLDVVAGVLYSSLILAVSLPALDSLDVFVLHSRWAPLLVMALPFVLALLCFRLDAWSTSRGDTAQILGTGAGVALASHVNLRLGFSRDPVARSLAFPSPSAGLFVTAAVRLVAGVAVLVLTRAVMKAVTLTTLCRVLRLGGGGDVRRARQHMEVELPYRYIVYGTVGFNVLFLVPLLLSYAQL
ncbi:sphingosine-1-phosphate phosphatase 1-like [Eucyclogobius newberryi]|uniref:sphingosine-1-phosphate phosphatase 1-like n=1 Tax=Eucyclogobius newberryi TaxID=166745 RepID=UPI003B59934E